MDLYCFAKPPHQLIVCTTNVNLPMGASKKKEPHLSWQTLSSIIAHCIVSSSSGYDRRLLPNCEAVRRCRRGGNIVQGDKFVVRVQAQERVEFLRSRRRALRKNKGRGLRPISLLNDEAK